MKQTRRQHIHWFSDLSDQIWATSITTNRLLRRRVQSVESTYQFVSVENYPLTVIKPSQVFEAVFEGVNLSLKGHGLNLAAATPHSDAFVLSGKPVPIVVSASGKHRPHGNNNSVRILIQRLIANVFADSLPLFLR